LSVTNEDGASIHWSYDEASRLIGEEFRDASGIPVTQTSYTYDAVGNRLSETADGATTEYTYNALDQLLSRGSAEYTYDGRGNLIQVADGVDVTAYTWDALDRLSTISGAGLAASYEYDADGRRVQSTVGMEVTNYLWDELSQCGDVVLEMDGSGALLASYVLAGPELISQRRAGSTSYYLHDAQGSVRGLADTAGEITDQYTYAAFGELVEQEGATDNPYRYTGQQYDEASGLYSLRARYYDPAAGRFLSADPLEQWRNVRELNRYSYAASDPVNLVDPTGRQALAEGVLTRMLTRGVAGMLAGACTGLVGATFFYILAYLGACGDEAMIAARNMTPAEVDRLIAQAVVMGAAMGAIGGIYVGAGPYAAAAFEIGMGAIGMTVSGLDIVTNGLNWCNGIAFAMSVAAVVHGAYKWHKLSAASHAGQMAEQQKPCADCDADPQQPTSQPVLDKAYADQRAGFLQDRLAGKTRGCVTIGVGVAEDAAGGRVVLVGSSEGAYLRPAVQGALQPGELFVGGSAAVDAEINIINYAEQNDLRLLFVGAGRAICEACEAAILGVGATPASPTRSGNVYK
jgi:RHS repeat-associated protein